MLSNIQVSPF